MNTNSEKMKNIQIANCYFSVTDDLSLLANAMNYLPFQKEESPAEADFLFCFYIDTTLTYPDAPTLANYENEMGKYSVCFYEGVYYWKLQRERDPRIYIMRLDLYNKEACISYMVEDTDSYYATNDFLRFSFIYASASFDTLLLHASCISYKGKGIAFVGRSGIGKSTHSSLWLEHISSAELLNDDQPAVRLQSGKAVIYGTPWSGKVPCYRPVHAPLHAILCMEQAKENHLHPLGQTILFSRLLSSCSLMKTDRRTLPQILNTLSGITGCVRGAVLENYPGKDAVFLSYHFLKAQDYQ